MLGRHVSGVLVAILLVSGCAGPAPTIVHEPGPPAGFTIIAPPAGASPTGVAAGTPVFVAVMRDIDSAQHTVWNPAPPDAFIVAFDVIDSAGNVRIAAGTSVQTTTNAQPRGRIGQQGSIVIGFGLTTTVEGFVVPLDGSYKWDGRNREGLTIGLTVGMLFLYPPFNFLHLLTRGSDVVLPAGSVLSTVVGPA